MPDYKEAVVQKASKKANNKGKARHVIIDEDELYGTELKGKKVVYVLFLFPKEEIIAKRLNKDNDNVGHIIPIININAWLCGWRSEGCQ